MLSGVLKANSLAFLLWHQQGFFFSFFPQRVLQPAWHQQPRHDSQTSYLKRKTCTFWNILNSIFCFIRPTMPESLLSVEATSTSIYGADFFSSFDRKCCQRCRCVCWNPLHAVCEVTELKHCLTLSLTFTSRWWRAGSLLQPTESPESGPHWLAGGVHEHRSTRR